MLGERPRLRTKTARVRYLAAKARQRAYAAGVHSASLSAVSDFASLYGLPVVYLKHQYTLLFLIKMLSRRDFSFSFSCQNCQLGYNKMSQVKRRKLITEEDEATGEE